MPVVPAFFSGFYSSPLFALQQSGAQLFPRPLETYPDTAGSSLWEIIRDRAVADPFNLVATALFLGAILHTFLAPQITRLSRRLQEKHRASAPQGSVSFWAEILHFLGEIEVVFGIWAVPLILAISASKSWEIARNYLGQKVDFTEPLFVVVIMAISATRPVLQFARLGMSRIASLGKKSPAAWWLTILTIGPLLGSLITEPAAMTLSALLLGEKFYQNQHGTRFRYATLGLLFVNISVGGTLTHFAAPPVLMVATKWQWDSFFMITQFGWKALVGILISNLGYFLIFRRELSRFPDGELPLADPPDWEERTDAIPLWVTLAHLAFLGWTVFAAHDPVLFVGGFLFFLAFSSATRHHQNPLRSKPALLVGCFLAGLVIHGGLQGWWIAPLIARLQETPLLLGATTLTAFNDNAAITYLATLVPNFSTTLQYSVVAGAVAGGGLTVIANAPNPAGQSILSHYFPNGISPFALLAAALFPTAVMIACFLFL